MFKKLMHLAVSAALVRGLSLGALAAEITKDDFGKLPKDLQAHYKESGDKYALEVSGAEDVGGLKTALEKERTAKRGLEKKAKELEEKLTAFDGLDAQEIKTLLERVSNDEIGTLLKAGKFEDAVKKAVDKATEKMRGEHERALKAATDKYESETKRSKSLHGRVLDDAIRAAAAKAGAHANGTEDALLRARGVFTITEKGEVVQLDADGEVVKGKDGKSPFSPAEWFESMKETAPHWFAATSTGGGAKRVDSGGKRTITRREFDALDQTARATFAKEQREGKAAIVDA